MRDPYTVPCMINGKLVGIFKASPPAALREEERVAKLTFPTFDPFTSGQRLFIAARPAAWMKTPREEIVPKGRSVMEKGVSKWKRWA